MQLTRLTAAFLALAMAVTGCGAGDSAPPSPSTPAPRWTAVVPNGIPADRLTDVTGGAGWDKGFVLAGSHTEPAPPNDQGIVNTIVPDVYASPDGAKWSPVTLSGLEKTGHKTPVAGYGGAVYVLGGTYIGAAVWRSEDGHTWTRSPLERSTWGEALTAVAAGPHGVVVVGFDRRIPVLDYDGVGGDLKFGGLRVWHSADGKTFSGPEKVALSGLEDGYLPTVAANADGFVILGVRTEDSAAAITLSSVDGSRWTTDDPGAMRGRPFALARSDDLTAVFADSPEMDGKPAVWRRRTGDDWTVSHDVSVGVLPDGNVSTLNDQLIRQVTAWRGWFVAAGVSAKAGGLWLSPDAARWDRVPVKANGFDATSELTIAGNGTAIIAVGHAKSGSVKIWKGA